MEYEKTSARGYVYDKSSSAVLNTDESDWLRFKAEKEKHKLMTEMQKRISDLEIKIANLERYIGQQHG